MTPINHDAVIDAIAMLLPDGIDTDTNWCEHRDIICEALGIKDEDDDLYEVIQRLVKEGRLRDTTDHGWTVLSYTEQARRIMAILPIDDKRDEYEERIADALAGKTEKL